MTAAHAEAQVEPLGANAQTVFTAPGAGCNLSDLVEVSASHFIFHFSSIIRRRQGLSESERPLVAGSADALVRNEREARTVLWVQLSKIKN